MANFPTLSQNPEITPWEEGVAKDPTVSTDFENGFRQTYPAFTRLPDKWKVGYRVLPTTDKNLIRNFEKSVKVGSDSFTWTNPIDSLSYDVRFLRPITYKPHDTISYWDVDFELEEI